eukprot:966019-Alexandrium_andersonii.AAC.1
MPMLMLRRWLLFVRLLSPSRRPVSLSFPLVLLLPHLLALPCGLPKRCHALGHPTPEGQTAQR